MLHGVVEDLHGCILHFALEWQAESTQIYTGPALLPMEWQAESTQIYTVILPVQEGTAHCATTAGRIYAYLQHTTAGRIDKDLHSYLSLSKRALLTVLQRQADSTQCSVINGLLAAVVGGFAARAMGVPIFHALV